MTYEWHSDDIRVHTSSYEWHTSTYEWHTDDIHTSDIRMAFKYMHIIMRAHGSGMQMTYEYIGVTYEWHTSDTRVHTIDIRMIYKMAYDGLENDIRNIKLYKRFGAFRS